MVPLVVLLTVPGLEATVNLPPLGFATVALHHCPAAQ